MVVSVTAVTAVASGAAGHDRTMVYRVPSGSMLPTLKIGMLVTGDLDAYRSTKPAIGDIVVLHPPDGADAQPPKCGAPHEGIGNDRSWPRPCGIPTAGRSTQLFFKRIVGVPGDRIAIVNGRVVRNGKQAHEPYIMACSDDAYCTFPRAVLISSGDYFVLGDNRGQSEDSRFWGPVKRSWIVAKIIRK
jgi:signal peptidase I